MLIMSSKTLTNFPRSLKQTDSFPSPLHPTATLPWKVANILTGLLSSIFKLFDTRDSDYLTIDLANILLLQCLSSLDLKCLATRLTIRDAKVACSLLISPIMAQLSY